MMLNLLAAATVVLISFDGLLPKQVTSKTAPNLFSFAQKGVSAKYMEPVFPSSTFVNHASLITGCTAGEHGIVSNNFIDPKRGKFGMEDDSNWQECEPLWAASSRQKMNTAIYVWPMSQTPWHGAKPAYVIPLPSSKEAKENFFQNFDSKKEWAQLLSWIKLPESKRPQLILGYFPDVDTKGHKYGPFAKETLKQVTLYDQKFGNFLGALKEMGLQNKIDIVIVSDHGMVTPKKPVYTQAMLEGLKEKLGEGSFEYAQSSATIINFYFKNRSDITTAKNYLKTFSHLNIHEATSFPKEWHYQNPRSGDLVVTVDPPYYMIHKKQNPAERKGYHGYDPKFAEVRAFFAAQGPDFKPAQLDKVRNIDIAPTIAKILKISFDGKKTGKPLDNVLASPLN
ncbi:MAG: alkaline phosphatase family protein [Deltaproteobacteria bacterium]|nr:alkaline phosphatase family protein [Deltaproteobacteria bacterium]